VKTQLLEVAAKSLGENPEDLDIRDRTIFSKKDPEKKSPPL
jgi:hypothetical protein